MILELLYIVAILTIGSANAVSDSVVTGSYNVSFDMGLNRSEYNITAEIPQKTETLDGSEKTIYNIGIMSINRTKMSEFNETPQYSLTAVGDLYTTADARIAVITISEYKEALTEESADDLAETLREVNRDSVGVSDVRVAIRAIDGTDGAIASMSANFDPNRLNPIDFYQILYYPEFDPSHTMIQIASFYPWDEGTLQLLKTIHVERIE